MDPQNIAVTPGADVVNPLTKFRFILRNQRKVILNKTEPSNVAKPYMLSNLIPNTMYTVVVTAGNSEGFGDAANVSFKTKEDGKILFHPIVFFVFMCAHHFKHS